MEEKLKFLKEYSMKNNPDIRIIAYNEMDTVPLNSIPELWGIIFREKEQNKRKNMIMDIWKNYVFDSLFNTIQYLENNLVNIDLIQIDKKYSILYSVKSENEEIQYYEGGNPLEKMNNSDLKLVWDQIPYSIRIFYENVHNGFYDYVSKAMGLINLESVSSLAKDEWGILEVLDKPLPIDLNTTFGFFKNGAGGEVVVDIKNCENDQACLWFSDEKPSYNLSFWDIVDEWIVIGLEDI